jgi:hypothetical protein
MAVGGWPTLTEIVIHLSAIGHRHHAAKPDSICQITRLRYI